MVVYVDATFGAYNGWGAVIAIWGGYRRLDAGALPANLATSTLAEEEAMRRARAEAERWYPGRRIVVVSDCQTIAFRMGGRWESRTSEGIRAAHLLARRSAPPLPVFVPGFQPTLRYRRRRGGPTP